MKTIIFYSALICLSLRSLAQDVIVKTDSSRIAARVLEISEDDIRYKLFNYDDGPVIHLKKNEVSYIHYKNGSTERFAGTRPVVAAKPVIDKYNLDKSQNVYVYQTPEQKIKRCEKLYAHKNYLGFSCTSFINGAFGLSYMRDVRAAHLILHVPVAFGFGRPVMTNSVYGESYAGSAGHRTSYDFMHYQAGLGVLFAPGMNREVNFLIGPSATASRYDMTTSYTYADHTIPYTEHTFKNSFSMTRRTAGVSVGLLARFTDRFNMNLLFTFGYKYDVYNQHDPYGYKTLESAGVKIIIPDNTKSYVSMNWSFGYRF